MGTVTLQPVHIPLEVQVVPVAEIAESPSMSQTTQSPVLDYQPQQLGYALSFVGVFRSDDLIDLDQWVVDAQSLWGTPDLRLEELEIMANLKTLLMFSWGHQSENKPNQPAREAFNCKMRAYLAGYNLLTRFKRRQWLRLFPAWTAEEGREQLESLANSGGYLEL